MTSRRKGPTQYPSCPRCGSPMQLRLEGGRRVWRCPNYWRFTSSCQGTVPIPDSERLDIRTIAQAQAADRYFSTRDGIESARKKQAGLRRTATSLRSEALDSPYLSSLERDRLAEASEILERLASAAERAKDELKRLEKEENQRLEAAARQADLARAKEFLQGFDGDGLIERCETLHAYVHDKIPSCACPLEHAIRAAKNPPLHEGDRAQEQLRRAVGRFLKEEFDHDASYSPEEFDTFCAEQERRRHTDAAIASSPNVVKLRK